MDAIDAIAEAWASIDGKLDLYHSGDRGYREGYRADAEELVKRARERGCAILDPGQPYMLADPACIRPQTASITIDTDNGI